MCEDKHCFSILQTVSMCLVWLNSDSGRRGQRRRRVNRRSTQTGRKRDLQNLPTCAPIGGSVFHTNAAAVHMLPVPRCPTSRKSAHPRALQPCRFRPGVRSCSGKRWRVFNVRVRKVRLASSSVEKGACSLLHVD